MTRSAADALLEAQADPAPRTGPRMVWNAADLMAHDFPEPRWAVPGLLAEGLTLLCGPPKVGKSWLAAGLGVSCALGGKALGKVSVEAGDVLYLSLEDPPRRLQNRLRKMLADDRAIPHRLTVRCDWPGGDGYDYVRTWLDDHPDARLVIVDVLARTRGPAIVGESAYGADYAAVSAWKAIADDYSVAVLVVHHVRNMGAEDFVDTVSGTNGLAGAADAIMVLQRARNAADAKLSLTGRDIEESAQALRFDAHHGAWELLDGPAIDYEVGETRAVILATVRQQPDLSPKAVADLTHLDRELVRKTMQRMVSDAQLIKDGAGLHRVPLNRCPRCPRCPRNTWGWDRWDTWDRGYEQPSPPSTR